MRLLGQRLSRLMLCVALCIPVSAIAQPWYQIEVILFAQDFPDLEAQGSSAETWPTEIDLAWQQPLLPLFESEFPLTPAMRKLPINSRTMNGDAYAFRVTQGYRLLWHQAWQQPLVDEADAPWILVEGGSEFEGRHELEGSLRIHLSRFLHMTAKLWLTDFSPPAETDQPTAFHLSQLPELPDLYNACSYLRFQPETPVEPLDILAEPPLTEDWWNAPYRCDSSRSGLTRGKPRYAPLMPLQEQGPEAQEISFFTDSSQEPLQLNIEMPQITLREPQPKFLPRPQVDILLQDQSVSQIIQIDMNRRLRSNEYHFVDHPKLGMLIRILEIEPPIIEEQP